MAVLKPLVFRLRTRAAPPLMEMAAKSLAAPVPSRVLSMRVSKPELFSTAATSPENWNFRTLAGCPLFLSPALLGDLTVMFSPVHEATPVAELTP